jgi:hypothetical protein
VGWSVRHGAIAGRSKSVSSGTTNFAVAIDVLGDRCLDLIPGEWTKEQVHDTGSHLPPFRVCSELAIWDRANSNEPLHPRHMSGFLLLSYPPQECFGAPMNSMRKVRLLSTRRHVTASQYAQGCWSDSGLLRSAMDDLGFKNSGTTGTTRYGIVISYPQQEMRAVDLHTDPTKHTRMLTPGDAPVLVQSQFAGNKTTSVGEATVVPRHFERCRKCPLYSLGIWVRLVPTHCLPLD